MRRLMTFVLLVAVCLTLAWPLAAAAQSNTDPNLALFTAYPSQVVGLGETVTISLKLRTATDPQVVQLQMQSLPDGWTAEFRGGGRTIQSAYVEPGTDTSVDLRLQPPASPQAGTLDFIVVGTGNGDTVTLPLELTVKDKVPSRLTMTADLPTLRGSPTSTFRYNVSLKNEGDEDVSVNLTADTPPDFDVTFTLSGQQVTDVPVVANSSKTLSVEAKPFTNIAAGIYPIVVHAQGGDVSADLQLAAEVTGQATLQVTTSDGRLSGQAQVGKDTSQNVIIKNTGSTPAQGVKLTTNAPSGWTVDIQPKQIDQIAPNGQAEVTATIRPADKAVAGDYVVTVSSSADNASSASADFRITVLTSTLWGVVGIAIIAVAVGVVALAVTRFGRR